MNTLQQLRPILIASPIQRSGTTLLQRLLSSSPGALIYGESCANDLNMLLGLLLQKRGMYGRAAAWRSDQLQKVLSGEVNDWIPDLMPDTAEYLDQFEAMVVGFLDYFAAFAQKNGREQWGLKLPAWNPFQLEQILRMMPAVRILYIVRDPEACVRSAKAIQFCQDLEATREFVGFWRRNLQDAQRVLDRPEVLWVDFDLLVAEPAAWIRRLEQFTGIEGIDPKVMDHRIGDYQHRTGPPTDLNEEELALIRSVRSEIAQDGKWKC